MPFSGLLNWEKKIVKKRKCKKCGTEISGNKYYCNECEIERLKKYKKNKSEFPF